MFTFCTDQKSLSTQNIFRIQMSRYFLMLRLGRGQLFDVCQRLQMFLEMVDSFELCSTQFTCKWSFSSVNPHMVVSVLFCAKRLFANVACKVFDSMARNSMMMQDVPLFKLGSTVETPIYQEQICYLSIQIQNCVIHL